MRPLLALLITALLGLTTVACGGASKSPGSTSPTSPTSGSTDSSTTTVASSAESSGYLKNDGDNDNDDLRHPVKAENDDRMLLVTYGHKADPADTRSVTTLVKSYYAASTAGEGMKACSLLYSSLAVGLADGQGQSAGGATDACAKPMSLLLKQQHQRLAVEDASTMTVIGVYVKGDVGLVVLGFRASPESEIIVEREGHTWKIDALFDSDVP